MAEEFVGKVKGFESVLEIALAGSVAGGDPNPLDLDIAMVLKDVKDIIDIAKLSRQTRAKILNLDIFVFDKSAEYLGRICHRKECPGGSVDCYVENCGKVKHLRMLEEFVFDQKSFFRKKIEILYSEGESVLLKKQIEVMSALDLKEPEGKENTETKELKCLECGRYFKFTPTEQKKFTKNGFKPPKRCEKCRDKQFFEEMGVEEADLEELKIEEKDGYFLDDGTQVEPKYIPKPGLCLLCRYDSDPEQKILCNLTRIDGQNGKEFFCEGFEKK